MALCAFSFPAIINRAAALDPQKSHSLGGTDLLFQPLHKLNQVCNVKMEVHLSFMWREKLGSLFFTKFKVVNFI